MFALSVLSPGGSSCLLAAGPETTLAEVRAKLEESLPEFCEVKLMQGTRELTDRDVVEVELQAVVTKSPAKALARMSDALKAIDKLTKGGLTETTWNTTISSQVDDCCQQFMEALSVLREWEDLAPAYCEQMLEVLEVVLGMLATYTSVPKNGFLGVDGSLISSCWQDELAISTAEVFGNVCGHPAKYIPKLTEMFGHGARMHGLAQRSAVTCLVGIAARCGGESLPSALRMRLTSWASDQLDHVEVILSIKEFTHLALQVLGALGRKDDHHGLIGSLLQFLTTHVSSFETPEDANSLIQHATAVQLTLCARQEDTAVFDADPELDLAKQSPVCGGEEVGQESDAGERVQDAGAEDGVEAESDPLLVHQQDLQEAIMRSKADGPPPICYDDSVALIRLTRCCEEALNAMRTSPLLADARQRVADAGCSLFPAVGHGACLLVPLTDEQLLELGLRLEKYHILALRSDKPAIVETLRGVPPGSRPKLRDDHRASPIEEDQRLAEGLPGMTTAASNDVFEELDLLHPYIRAKIHQFTARNDGISEPSSMSTVTESAPCGDDPCMHRHKLSGVNPRHWK